MWLSADWLKLEKITGTTNTLTVSKGCGQKREDVNEDRAASGFFAQCVSERVVCVSGADGRRQQRPYRRVHQPVLQSVLPQILNSELHETPRARTHTINCLFIFHVFIHFWAFCISCL